MDKQHWPIKEDAGGYFCGTCGLSSMDDSKCIGPRPQLDRYFLAIAVNALTDDDRYNKHSKREAAESIKNYLDWQGCAWRVRPPVSDTEWNEIQSEFIDIIERNREKKEAENGN